jgi:hypothetical protein
MTEIMRIKNKIKDPRRLHQENVKAVENCIYLCSVVSKDGKQRKTLNAESTKPDMPSPIWRLTVLSHQKIRILNTYVK